MRNRMWIGAVGAGVVALLGLQQAEASQFYGVTTNGRLLRFDMSAQTVTAVSNLHVGPTQLNVGFTELSSDDSGNLYALRSYGDDSQFPPAQFNEIIKITNPSLGNSLLNASYGGGFGQVHTSLAFANGNFYTVRNNNGQLGTLDITSAAFTPVSGVAHGSPWYTNGLAVNPATGQAYSMVDRGIPIIPTVDFTLLGMNLNTGASSDVGSLGLGLSYTGGALRFDQAGIAYTVNQYTGDVFTLNVATGAATFLFAGGATAVGTTGLSLIVPGPSGAAALAIGMTLVSRRRVRR